MGTEGLEGSPGVGVGVRSRGGGAEHGATCRARRARAALPGQDVEGSAHHGPKGSSGCQAGTLQRPGDSGQAPAGPLAVGGGPAPRVIWEMGASGARGGGGC